MTSTNSHNIEDGGEMPIFEGDYRSPMATSSQLGQHEGGTLAMQSK